MLNDYRIMVVNVGGKLKGCLWQLGLLQRRELTGKQDLNKTSKPETINGCEIMVIHFGTKTLGDL
jgi:hypothetical protein